MVKRQIDSLLVERGLVESRAKAQALIMAGGGIKQPIVHARVLGRFIAWITEHGFRLGGLVASPILGASGNKEFFVLLRLI